MAVLADGAGGPHHVSDEVVEGYSLRLLGPFELGTPDGPLALGSGCVQLLAFLGLNPGTWQRTYLAGQLWPFSSECRSRANLRNAIWRIEAGAPGLLTKQGDRLGLSPLVRCDLDDVRDLAVALTTAADRPVMIPVNCAHRLSGELLPGSYGDWVIFERNRLRQLFLHALEIAADYLVACGRHAEALDAALAAVALEPLRETAHRAAARVHLAEGNVGAARRQYAEFHTLVRSELGVAPSEAFRQEVSSTVSAVAG